MNPLINKTLHRRFERQALATPEAIALVFKGQTLSYKELNQQANHLARSLKDVLTALGVPVPMVLVSVGRGFNAVISVLAILKAGGCCIPLNPYYPVQRLEGILNDSAATVILCEQQFLRHLRRCLPNVSADLDFLVIEDYQKASVAKNYKNFRSVTKETTVQDAAYIVYTPGEQGEQRGVVMNHIGVINLLEGQRALVDFTTKDRISGFSFFSVDTAIWEMYAALLSGATLCLLSNEEVLPGEPFFHALRDNQISIGMVLPASLLLAMPSEDLPHLKKIIVGGEPCSEALVERWGAAFEVYYAYGQTETTLCAALSRCLPGQGGSGIGKPLKNVSIYILDEEARPASMGITGEIYIGGIGVAPGYHRQAALTAQRFVVNSFSQVPGARLYRTGDRARREEGGWISYRGRRDDQVKIQGYRVELREIELALLKHELIQQAIVIFEKKEKTPLLAAYLVFQADDSSGYAGIQSFLRKLLPDYMIPSIFIQLKKLPLTLTGKVDRAALSFQSGLRLKLDENPCVAARVDEEQALLVLWKEVLDLDRIGIFDDFFALGGSSLLAAQLASRIQATFQTPCSVKDVMDYPVIAQLNLFIQGRLSHLAFENQSIPPVDREHPSLPLSLQQETLWALNHCRVSVGIRLRGNLQLDKLNRSIDFLIQRHEIFRTVFKKKTGNMRPQLLSPRSFSIEMKPVNRAHLDNAMVEASHRPFYRSKGPLIRMHLFRLGPQEHVFLVTQHPLISDRASVAIFLKELAALYAMDDSFWPVIFLPLRVQYLDYAAWQQQSLASDQWAVQVAYWRNKLAKGVGVALPITAARPSFKTYNARRHTFYLGQEIVLAMHDLERRRHFSLFVILLSSFALLLSRYSGQEDIILVTPIRNRSNKDTATLLGPFADKLALRIDLSSSPDFFLVLDRVKQVYLEAQQHQNLPFDYLLSFLEKDPTSPVPPIGQVMFELQDLSDVPVLAFPGIEEELLIPSHNPSPYELALSLSEGGYGLTCTLEYNTDLFSPERIAALASDFENLLSALIYSDKNR